MNPRQDMQHTSILRTVVGVALAGTLFAQLVALPWLSGVMADDYPEFAHLRWPLLAASLLGVACIQVVMLCVWRLLGMVARDAIFSGEAFAWVDRMIAALLVGSAVVVAVLAGLAIDGAVAHAGLNGVLLLTAVTSMSGALLLVVLRELLRKAAAMRADLADVI